MIAFPLYIFLFIYLFFLCVFIIFSLVNAYHILQVGALTPVSTTVTLITTAFTLATLYFTWKYIIGIDWGQSFVLFENFL